jgi:DNA-binding NarL/FixJ family response regulator
MENHTLVLKFPTELFGDIFPEGYKSKEIADYLSISINTVDKHRANLMRKLDLHNASALTHFALKEGLLGK